MKKYRKRKDTDSSGIEDDEVVAASLWEMLRLLSPEQLKSIGGIHGAAALRMLEQVAISEDPKLAKRYGLTPVPLEDRWPGRAWKELSEAQRKLFASTITPRGAHIIEAETVAVMHELAESPVVARNNPPICSMLGMSPLDPAAVPKNPTARRPNYAWDLSKKPEQPAEQRVGLTIDWSKGIILICRDFKEWLTRHAPPGTPGTNGITDPQKPREGTPLPDEHRSTLRYISWWRRRKMGETDAEISSGSKDRPDESTVRKSRSKLTDRYRDWLGVGFN